MSSNIGNLLPVLYSHLNFEYMKEADRRSNTFLDVIQIPIDVDWNLEKTSQRSRDISYDNAFNSTSNKIKRVLA